VPLPLLAHIPGGGVLGPLERREVEISAANYIVPLERSFSAPQRTIYESKTRFLLLCCGRRFGKTFLAIHRLVTWAMAKPYGNFWYVTSTYRAAKRIAWKALKRFLDRRVIGHINNGELTITLVNGATISLMGADQPDSLRGDSLSGCVIDEAAFTKPEAWTEVIRPALSDQQGPCWHITTPKGFNHFHELWEKVEDDPDWSRFSYTTLDGGRVPENEVEAAKRDLDPRTFRQEYLASFESAAGRCYYDFSDENISEEAQDDGGDVYVGLDFNVSIMAGVICSRWGKGLQQFDEISMPNSNTDEVGAYLADRFKGRRVIVVPDPTGASRKTSASTGVTDHGILRSHGLTVKSPGYDWNVKDKVNATNALIHTAVGERRLRVHPRCKKTIKAYRGVCFKEGSEEFVIDKEPGIEHWTDGAGYLALVVSNRVRPHASGGSNFRVS
jgi:hypothetical protein